ncbi:MAG: hypothetical protein HY951_03365 [Bacteroidia bacterium]|nr:hypothetical protein [Bacteroidia bacterium]
MKIEINEEIITTTNCIREYPCFNSESHHCCKVVRCIDGAVHFVEPVERTHCFNMQSFGYSYFCSCPVRKEIFNKYGL